MPHNVISQRVRQLHRLAIAERATLELAGEIGSAAAPAVFIGKDFQQLMLDAEIYVDRIADMRVNDMNVVLEAVRQMALMKNGGDANDLHLRTL